MTVVTYGGGEILKNVFDAVAMLMNGQQENFFKPLAIILASMGCFWAVARALFSNSAQALLSGYILPLIGISGLLMVPTASVHIEDVIKDRSYKIDHVPFLLAKFSELASSTGHSLTTAFERVMHVPNDLSYNKTGMIFGAENAIDISKYEISNGDLKQNLKRFCKHCVLYDISLGKYSIDELKKTSDLWKFFEEKTSTVRLMQFTSLGEDKEQYSYVTCKDAIKKMSPYFEEEKRYYGKSDIVKNLPLTFQAITGLQKEREELIGQQLMMHVLSEEYSGNNFAKERAYAQQKSTYQVLGALASNSLVTLRVVLEAIVYASFILILPLALLPNGIKFIFTWLGLVVWIQLWPPFYAIINYIMQTVAHGYVEGIFGGLTDPQKGLSFFTSVGIRNLQEDVFALSGYLAASIPFLTYAILKGGISSFVQLAGSMMSPAQSAASTAASEQVRGNYSFANASFGQRSYHNANAFQSQLAPSFSAGYFSENTGLHSTIYGPDEKILKQGNSDLRTSFFSDDSINQSLQKAKQHATSCVETSQKNYLESTSVYSRNMGDYVEHLANSQNYSENDSSREGWMAQTGAQYVQNLAENFGKQTGLSARKSLDLLLRAGAGINLAGLFSFGTDLKIDKNVSTDEVLSSAINISKNDQFQQSVQEMQDFAKLHSRSTSDDEGTRLSHCVSHSIDSMRSSQESFQMSLGELNQVSENVAWMEQHSHTVKNSLNQDFLNWATKNYTDQGGLTRVNEILSREGSEKQSLVNAYVCQLKQNNDPVSQLDHYVDPKQRYSSSDFNFIDSKKELHSLNEMLNEKMKGMQELSAADLHGDSQEKFHNIIQGAPQTIDRLGDNIQKEFEETKGKGLLSRLMSPFSSTKEMIEKPFWLNQMRDKDE